MQCCLLALLQVNITLLDINDNYPTWKDEPYFINLVEMTPPNSDVTTVHAKEGGCCAKSLFLSPGEVVTCLAGAGCHLQTGVTSYPMSPPVEHHLAEIHLKGYS